MQALATLYREAQFFAHAAHNLVAGATFFEDHAFLGDLYGTYEAAYDSLIERSIGTNDKPLAALDPLAITRDAASSVADKPIRDAKKIFVELLQYEKDIVAEIETLVADKQSTGTENLLQGLADESEARMYKMLQRTK